MRGFPVRLSAEGRGGRRGGMGACVFAPLCVCGVRGWLPACLCVRLVYRGSEAAMVGFFWCVSKSPVYTLYNVGYTNRGYGS